MVDRVKKPKPIRWVGSSKRDLQRLPREAVRNIGFALWYAQMGDRHPAVKALHGFGGASVLEVVEAHAGDTFRAVYTVWFAKAIYVLHVFQKKSKTGTKTPAHEMALVQARLKLAQADYQQYLTELPDEDSHNDS
ncbi:MAG TPA: type II toxin-antitoxin system RelE/ParE family toxin [Phycisphaerae bacterium]|nr:type II toxin-antitoxin system RelE/ParE family toxin [Phycisphaerae bacterium]